MNIVLGLGMSLILKVVLVNSRNVMARHICLYRNTSTELFYVQPGYSTEKTKTAVYTKVHNGDMSRVTHR